MRIQACTLALLGLGAGAARADVITIGSAKDNTLYEESGGGLSNGSGEHFFAGLTDSAALIRRGVVEFDIAGSLPAGAVVTSVTLDLYMSRTQAGPEPVGLHHALTEWGEGASVASGQEGAGTSPETGDATWIHTFYRSAFWTTPGGDFMGTASATTTVDGNGHYLWSTSQLASDVQAWLDNPSLNHGWVVVGHEVGVKTAKRFDSRENSNAGRRPQLTIVFDPPAATGACCFSDGTCAVLDSATCAGQGGTYQGNGTSCTPNPCPQPSGACCLADGTCSVLTEADCLTQGGTWQGAAVPCTPNPCPVVLTPFVDPLPIPAVAQPVSGTAGGVATYDLAMTQFQQQLHSDLPPTTVWGYGGTYPGPTIESSTGNAVTVQWINDLRDDQGDLLTQHHLPVDLCPHGPNMEGDTPRTVVHLHGGHVPADVDGYPEDTFLPGESATYVYPVNQEAATLWYHDHALGITRLNVMMGLAGFFLVRDAFEASLGLPDGAYEIPLVLQDRTFNADGSFSYPAAWQEDFFGDTVLVNGKVWPYLQVDQGKYRFRILNGSNSRTYTLSLSNGASMVQIGTDGGLLSSPVSVSEITLASGERADMVLDFELYPAGTEIVLTNSAPAHYPGTPGVGVIPNVMKFIVGAQPGDTDALPSTLREVVPIEEFVGMARRSLELRKGSDPCTGDIWLIDGLHWDDITEYPILGTTEVWSFVNRSGIAHPMHMHLVFFQVLDRQPFEVIDGEVVPTGPRVPPDPEEAGWKDTAIVNPSEILRVIARFTDYTGKYAYHCHILEHEDHEMMRQFEVIRPKNWPAYPVRR